MLKGKTVVLGVTGSIAAYKIANLASALVKLHADVNVIMTKNATNFINPITFETLTGNKCLVDTFDRNFEFNVEHVALAKRADIFMVAPASANVIGKIAGGIADDMLTTTIMAAKCPKLRSAAMNTNMFENPIVQDNLKKLENYGYEIISPASGYLACGDTGAGKMPEPETLLQYIIKTIAFEKDLLGKNVLVTAGPTQEKIDPVRYITNHSTGKMGYAIAREAKKRGAEVILVSGPSALTPPEGVRTIKIESASSMREAVLAEYPSVDIVIKAAAVADYRVKNVSDHKIKKKDEELVLHLEKNPDILKELGELKQKQTLVGFAAETQKLIDYAKEKIQKKNLDMIIANDVSKPGAGFNTDTNIIKIITRDGNIEELPMASKDSLAGEILDRVMKLR